MASERSSTHSALARLKRSALVVCLLAGTLTLPVLASSDAHAQTPAAPTIFGVASGDQALTVAWSAPDGVNVADITAYDVRYIATSASAADKADDTKWTVLDPAWEEGSLRVIVSPLTNGTTYDVQVRAVTSSNGSWSATSTGTPAEPGSSRATATAFVSELPVRGVLDSDTDVDYFRFQVSGTREFFVLTTGATDTYGKLYRSSGNLIDDNDDSNISSGPRNFKLDGRLTSGTHYIEVTGYDGATGPYTLHLQTAADTTGISNATPIELNSATMAVFRDTEAVDLFDPGDDDYFKLELTAETTITARVSGFVTDTVGAILDSRGVLIASNDDAYLEPTRNQFALRETLPAGIYYIGVEPYYGDKYGLYDLYVYESEEPGSSRTSAAEIDISHTAGGTTDAAGDYFTFTLAESTRVALVGSSREVEIEATLQNSVGSTLDVNYYEVNFSAGLSRGIYTFAIFETLTAGTYYFKVDAEQPSDTGEYLVLLRTDGAYARLEQVCPSPPVGISDTFYGCQWHLNNTGQFGSTADEDINIDDTTLGSVWNTTMGSGVNVVVVDQGLDYFHEDLTDNVQRSSNYSYRRIDDVFGERSSHGTAAAGLIAATNNGIGTRGVAPRASIYAYDLLSAYSTYGAADAASRSRESTSVSNNSWGPLDGPGASHASRLWELAIDSGVTEGDGGKGVVYVWSAGNGDDNGDWASLDEIATYYGVTAACAVDNHGKRSVYSEQGPNLWVCAPSSSVRKVNPGIATTRSYSRYTNGFGGTSAAAPIVSGVVALVRAADRTLTWRDVKLILAASARKNDDTDSGWETGALKYGSTTDSYNFNHKYGFGVVDASAAVALAGSWTNVPEMGTATASYDTSRSIPSSGSTVSTTVDLEGDVEFVEFVEVNVDFSAPRFRDLKIELVSPSGAISELTVPNSVDCGSGTRCSLTGEFRFGSARHLGEDPRGTWTLRVADRVSGGALNTAKAWDLKVYGHRQSPEAVPLRYVRPGTGSLVVAWDEPAYTGTSGITGYEIRHIASSALDKSDGEWDIVTSSCTSSPCTETINVSDGTRRDVQVRAMSGRSGTWSATARGRPGAANSEPFFADGERTKRIVAENAGSGANVGSVVAARDYENDSFTYALSGTDAALFEIDDSSGQLTTKFDPDFEVRDTYTVTMSVTDGKDDDGTADTEIDDTITVTIEVANADEPPTFQRCVTADDCSDVSGLENIEYEEGGFSEIAVYDVDDSDSEEVHVDVAGADGDEFYVNSLGELHFYVVPDYEQPTDNEGLNSDNVYELELTAFDGTTTVSVPIEVTVTDKNEKPTITNVHDGILEFDENDSISVNRYGAEDPEKASVIWTLSGNDRLDFEINSGLLTFESAPNFEMPADHNRNNLYEVTIEASDGDNVDDVPVQIRVKNVNEPAVISGPSTSNFPENSSSIVASYDANDPEERERVTWSLSGTDDGFFEIDSSGDLRFKVPPDHEAARGNTYQVTVEASDGKDALGNSDPSVDDRFDVTVNVTDVDEAPTITSGPTSESFAEGHTGEVARFEAEDPEGEDVIWSLLGTDRADLTIGRNDGIVRFASTPDYEKPVDGGRNNSYVVTVQASDGMLTATQSLTVSVTNENEDGVITLSSSQPQVGTALRATLSDPDGGVRAPSWTWERSLAGSLSGWTTITGASSSSYTPIGDDQNRHLRVTVSYTDRQGSGKSAQLEIDDAVRAAPVGNRRPEFASGTGVRSIDENTEADREIGAPVEADDPDSDDLTYSLGGSDASSFDIDPDSGQLLTKVALDHERKPTYQVSVTARDPSGLSDAQSVTITVENVDEAPAITGPTATGYAESRTDAVARYTAADPEGEDVTWSLRGTDSAALDIDEDSGVLKFRNPPDFDASSDNDYMITVRAFDGTLYGTLDVTVRVTDVNEPPVVSSPGGMTSFVRPENGVGFVDSFSATDPEGVTVTWSLGGPDSGDFKVEDGDLLFLETPNFEQPADSNRHNDYEITVRAFDGEKYGTLAVTVTVENVDEPGSLELSATLPGVGSTLSAILTEPDVPVTDQEWMWWRSDDRNDPGSWVLIDGATSSSYRPVAADLGHWLRVRVTYMDAYGSKTLEMVSINTVQSMAGPTRPVGPTGPTGPTAPGGGGGGGGGDVDVGIATFVVANGWSAADVGVASVLAARTSGAVVVYTAGDMLSAETAMLMREALPAEVVIVGGTAAVSRDVRTQIRAASSESGLSRITGADRADTAAGTARRILGGPSQAGRVTLIVANGWSPPDIGAAAALAARSGRSAVLYTRHESLPAASAALLRDYQVARVMLIGGTAAISNEVYDEIAAVAGGASISRLTGADRVDTAAQAARRVLGSPASAPDDVTLVIANGWSAPDVGVAAALAAATENSAVAYTSQRALPAVTAALIRDYRPSQVIIVGGSAAVTNSVRTAITDTAPSSANVRRITGSTRIETAARAARRILASL